MVPGSGRGPKRVAHPRLTRGALLAAADLAVAVTVAEKEELDRAVERATADADQLRKAGMARGAEEAAGETQLSGEANG